MGLTVLIADNEAATTILNDFSEMTRKLRFPEYSPDAFPNPGKLTSVPR